MPGDGFGAPPGPLLIKKKKKKERKKREIKRKIEEKSRFLRPLWASRVVHYSSAHGYGRGAASPGWVVLYPPSTPWAHGPHGPLGPLGPMGPMDVFNLRVGDSSSAHG